MTQQEPDVNSLPTLMIRVPPRNGETDHWVTQSSASNLLWKSGVRGHRWAANGPGSDQYFTGKFTDEQLTWLGLHGCEVKGNVTKIVQEEALRKIKQRLAPLQLSKATLEEVDIEQMFAEQVAEWVRVQKNAHGIR